MDSILTSVKKLLGIEAEYTHFDADIIMHINSSFVTLKQIGVLTETSRITDDSEEWSDFFDDDLIDLVKPYVYLKVRLVFDPPSSSVLMESMQRQIAEAEWRLNIQAEEVEEDG